MKNEPDQNKYTLWVDDTNVGFIDYKIDGSQITFVRTEIDPDHRRGGFGGALVKGALDDVRVNSERTLIPKCPFTAKWIDAHPDYQELVDRG